MVKETDTRAKSKSRDRRDRRAAPTENLLAQEEDDEDAVEVIEEQEQEREQPEFSIIPPRRRDTISFEIDDPEAEDLVRREYYSKDQFRKKVIEDVDALPREMRAWLSFCGLTTDS
ncbi:hypothetical protein N7486_010657 [Penicillium sp. IBT 16267x]|nr:hypothetical protein N7486_010657 [Penicillium sp. IBT 16267x]